jgi:hypothetical protein
MFSKSFFNVVSDAGVVGAVRAFYNIDIVAFSDQMSLEFSHSIVANVE